MHHQADTFRILNVAFKSKSTERFFLMAKKEVDKSESEKYSISDMM